VTEPESGRSERFALDTLRKFTEVGIALSAEKDHACLMQLILSSARELTGADGGTLYSRREDDHLHFEIMMNASLGVHHGGTSESRIEMPSVPLYTDDGEPNRHMVAAWAAVSGETVNIPDAYHEDGFDFSGTRDFDHRTGYRSRSFLTVPMRNHQDEVIGVLQLINKGVGASVVAFDDADRALVESLASQAAISLTNKRLIEDQARLFESFIELIAGAIDDKSPYTGGHCRRVPELTMMLADAAAATREGPLADFEMNDDDRYELRIAGWLHDCGKVTTPEHVMDKAMKLETIHDRIQEVATRFEVIKRDFRLAALQRCLSGELDPAAMDEEVAREVALLDEERGFLEICNRGGETMSEHDRERVRSIARREWVDAGGNLQPLLSEEEVYNLCIERGTLTTEEREIINHHIVATISMLESLPYPKHLARVPEFAGGHHEHMDGSGYPRGLTAEQMSVQARVMAIADVFEALTAGDRPYKKAMKLSQALGIMGRMSEQGKVDPNLFQVFVRDKVYLRYAETFLDPEQIDEVDLAAIPGLHGATPAPSERAAG
jgi:HD-GYP domain-containing protein (c-di-GMP phosphodiesterase class II)